MSGSTYWSSAFLPEQRGAACSHTRRGRQSLQPDHGAQDNAGGCTQGHRAGGSDGETEDESGPEIGEQPTVTDTDRHRPSLTLITSNTSSDPDSD